MMKETIHSVEQDRVDGPLYTWERLQAGYAKRAIGTEMMRPLSGRLKRESSREDWYKGVELLLDMLIDELQAKKSSEPVAKATAGSEPNTLPRWLWNPFSRPSVLLGLSDSNYRRRDDGAVLQLARHLSKRDFAKTTLHPITMQDPQWVPILAHNHPEVICLVGRLGLYGGQAIRRWGCDKLRFYFPKNTPPKSRQPGGKLDWRYHCINEDCGGAKPEQHHTKQKGRDRTDYGLIQRYTVTDEGRDVVVVTCAGASWVGTLAAAQWAAEILPYGATEKLIPVPRDIRPNSRLEALVKVTTDPGVHTWALTGIDLCRLIVDDWEWSQSDSAWRTLPGKRVILECRNGDPEEIVAVVNGDSRKCPMKGHTYARVLTWIYKKTMGVAGSLLDSAALARDKSMWGKKGISEQLARQWISWVSGRYLDHAIHIQSKGPIRLLASLVIQPIRESFKTAT